jgi:hypothetical protein
MAAELGMQKGRQIIDGLSWNIIIIKAQAMHRFFVKWRAIAVPKNSKVFVFSLHALDIPVVGLLSRIAGVQNISDAKTPVPYTHIYDS